MTRLVVPQGGRLIVPTAAQDPDESPAPAAMGPCRTCSTPLATAESTPPTPATEAWQQHLQDAVRDPAELCRILGLPAALAAEAIEPAEQFSLLVPRGFIARMRPGDPRDPLLRQVWPAAAEMQPAPGYEPDPLGEAETQSPPGLLWKYQGRSLMVTTGACGVHCRFCFRRHFPYAAAPPTPAAWEPALRCMAAEPSLHELILSGGDPLCLPDDELAGLVARAEKIPQLRRLRWHTRLPVLIPERVTPRWIEILRGTRLTTWVVLHVNHAAELNAEVAAALGGLTEAGVPLLSQSVLLAGVNDSAAVLAELFERLIDLRIAPYYLHQLDPVAGAAHFATSVARGQALLAELRRRLPGYALPRYVRETPQGSCKEPLA